MGEGKYQRFKESSRWLVEANPIGWGQVAKLKPAREEADSGGEVSMCQMEDGREEPMADKMIEALVLLEEKTRAIMARLKQIETRMGELREGDEKRRRALAAVNPGKIHIKPGLAVWGYKCKMG
jgi:hypothetical protein